MLRELIGGRTRSSKPCAEQGKLDAALRQKILACREKKELEELYLPYEPNRRTGAAIARERGLEGLAAMSSDRSTREIPRQGAAAVRQSRPRGARRRGSPAGSLRHRAEEWADDAAVRGVVCEAMKQGTLDSYTALPRDIDCPSSRSWRYHGITHVSLPPPLVRQRRA